MTDINLTGTISAASLSGRLSNLYIPKDVTEYDGPTSITPSTIQQQFETARKLVNENLVVEGAKLDVLEATENGTYRPDGDAVGFSQVDVDVNPDLRPLSVSENGQYSPDGFDGFSEVNVNTGIKAITGKFEITRNLTWGEALEISIPHELGAVPSMIVIWTHNNDEARNGDRVIVATWINKDEFNFPWSENCLNPFVERWFLRSTADTNLSLAIPTHSILGLKHLPTATEFHLIETNNTGSYKAGTYYYLLMAGNWEQYADANSGNVTA
jgi:hypothetical protein